MKERLWQVGFMLALFGMFLLGAAVGQGKGIPSVIRAQRFEIIDSKGRPVGIFSAEKQGAKLILKSVKGSGMVLTTTDGAAILLDHKNEGILLSVGGNAKKNAYPLISVQRGEALAMLKVFNGDGALWLIPSTGIDESIIITPTGTKHF